MRHAMWMGTRGFEMWVPMPAVGPSYANVGWSAQSQHLAGGATLRQSKSGHGTWQLTWSNGTSWDDIMPVRDMASGVYDTKDGVNLVYWLDPTAMARNVLPQGWAAPHVAADDGMPLMLDVRPGTRVELPGNRLPARTALYPASTKPAQRLYIPIPPGHIFRFGYVGDAETAGQIRVADVNASGDTTDSVIAPDPVSFASTGFWTNVELPRDGTSRIGVELSVAGTEPLNVRAMLATVLPAIKAPQQGMPWRGGMGHSGCQFVDKVGLTPQSVPLDQVGASTNLIETGAYL